MHGIDRLLKVGIVWALAVSTLADPLQAEIAGREGNEPRAPIDERPFVTLLGGLSSVDRDGSLSRYADRGILGFRIGFSKERDLDDSQIRLLSARNLFLERSLSGFRDVPDEEIETSLWRFGFTHVDGSGYRIGEGTTTLIGTQANSMGWAFLDLEEERLQERNPDGYRQIGPFLDHVRFGSAWRGGLRFSPHRNFAVEANYQRSILFPRTKGLDLLTSHALEMIALEAIDPFLRAVTERTPGAVPILSFLLRGGISFGFYELRRENMHWPLDTAAPLTEDSFRFALETVY